MPHFVTAAAGEPHVTSTDTAHYNAGTLGPGCYVLPLRDRMACTMVDSNTLRILAGDAVVCGRQWAIEGDYEELNIDNGVPGYNRIDLVVCRIEIGENEAIELKVYKGEETTGTPVVPGHVTGDLNDGDNVCEMPICSVRINGINPQAPEMLTKESIDIMALLEELRDYKSQAINGSKLVDRSVGAAKLADGAVTSAKIADGAIAAADIANDAVSSAKLSQGVRDSIATAASGIKFRKIVVAQKDVTSAVAVGAFAGVDIDLTPQKFAKAPYAIPFSTGHLTTLGATATTAKVTATVANFSNTSHSGTARLLLMEPL